MIGGFPISKFGLLYCLLEVLTLGVDGTSLNHPALIHGATRLIVNTSARLFCALLIYWDIVLKKEYIKQIIEK